MSLEQCLEFINNDELVEVTPVNVRMRKRILDSAERKRAINRSKKIINFLIILFYNFGYINKN